MKLKGSGLTPIDEQSVILQLVTYCVTEEFTFLISVRGRMAKHWINQWYMYPVKLHFSNRELVPDYIVIHFLSLAFILGMLQSAPENICPQAGH